MNKSIEVLKSIYKPYRYTIKGKSTILETTCGNFIIKPKNKDINELYTYLTNRGFMNYPKIIDSSRDEVNVFEYVEKIELVITEEETAVCVRSNSKFASLSFVIIDLSLL